MTAQMRKANLVAGSVLVALSFYILYTASGWTLFNSDGPGPGFFPIGYGLMMLGLSATLIAQSLSLRPTPPQEHDRSSPTGTRAAMLAWIAIIASIPLMWLLGFVIGFGLTALFLIRVVFGRSWRTSIVTAAAIAGSLYLVFSVLLGASLPVGRYWAF